jgi:hypothetical protein
VHKGAESPCHVTAFTQIDSKAAGRFQLVYFFGEHHGDKAFPVLNFNDLGILYDVSDLKPNILQMYAKFAACPFNFLPSRVSHGHSEAGIEFPKFRRIGFVASHQIKPVVKEKRFGNKFQQSKSQSSKIPIFYVIIGGSDFFSHLRTNSLG